MLRWWGENWIEKSCVSVLELKSWGWGLERSCYTMGMKRPGLYANINARRKAGTSRPKSQSTISPRTWRLMKAKRGGFSEKK